MCRLSCAILFGLLATMSSQGLSQTPITGLVTRDRDNAAVAGVQVVAKRVRDNKEVSNVGTTDANGRYQIQVNVPLNEAIVLEFLPPNLTLALSSLRLLSSERPNPPQVKQQEINKVLSVGGASYDSSGAAQKGGGGAPQKGGDGAAKADASDDDVSDIPPTPDIQNQLGKLMDFENFYYRTLSTQGPLSEFDNNALEHIRAYLPKMPEPLRIDTGVGGAAQKSNGLEAALDMLENKQSSVFSLFGVAATVVTSDQPIYQSTSSYQSTTTTRRCRLFRRRR